jgi:hypothetical protein
MISGDIEQDDIGHQQVNAAPPLDYDLDGRHACSVWYYASVRGSDCCDWDD